MKTIYLFLFGIIILFPATNVLSEEQPGKNTPLNQGAMKIVCTPDLKDLTSQWTNEFNKLNPGTDFRVGDVSENNDIRSEGEMLGFTLRVSPGSSSDTPLWKIVVGRDIFVPVFSGNNPLLSEIQQKGVSPEKLKKLFENPENQNWGTLLSGDQNLPVHIYMVNDEALKAGFTRFIQEARLPVNGITFGSSNEIRTALENDPYAIGFCNVVDLQDQTSSNPEGNIRLLPIDKNGNGTLDNMEDIYSDLNQFMRGVWIGKYPKALYNNIYAFSSSKPKNEVEIAFLKWVVTDGQEFIDQHGYSGLVSSEVQSQLDKIVTSDIIIKTPNENSSLTMLLLQIITVVIIAILIVAIVLKRIRTKMALPEIHHNSKSESIDENVLDLPNGLYYDKTHTWAFMEKDGTVSIGIDDFMQHITGPITRIDMKKPGAMVKKGYPVLSLIQSGKLLNMYAPVSGTIIKQNEALMTDSVLVNKSPYSDGWIYTIEPSNWISEIQLLDMADKYKKFIVNEFARVKDFLASVIKTDSPAYAHVVLQDGGMLKDGVLSGFGPEVWEDFQTGFIDTYK